MRSARKGRELSQIVRCHAGALLLGFAVGLVGCRTAADLRRDERLRTARTYAVSGPLEKTKVARSREVTEWRMPQAIDDVMLLRGLERAREGDLADLEISWYETTSSGHRSAPAIELPGTSKGPSIPLTFYQPTLPSSPRNVLSQLVLIVSDGRTREQLWIGSVAAREVGDDDVLAPDSMRAAVERAFEDYPKR